MKTQVYQIFGSEDSLDVDVLFFVEEMPASIQDRLLLTKSLIPLISENHPGKTINGNLATLGDGHLMEVYKGTADELNNALLDTYSLHQQTFSIQIRKRLLRDVDLKYLRAIRSILSQLSRTDYRSVVKAGLNGDVFAKIETLERIRFTEIHSFGDNVSPSEAWKTIAFQLGQTLALEEGVEIYTKRGLVDYFPSLSHLLFRNPISDIGEVESLVQRFLRNIKARAPQMKYTKEYSYELPQY